MKRIIRTTHLKLSNIKLPLIPRCKGGIMDSLRFATSIRRWAHDKNFSHFEFQGLVSTQPKTKKAKAELWLVHKDGHFKSIFASFGVPLNSGCTLAWKSQKQIEKFCEKNPDILKQYHQGVYFLISRCESDDLYVVHVEQNSNVKRFDPRFTTYSIDYGGGVDECNHGTEKELHCFILPANWRRKAKEKVSKT